MTKKAKKEQQLAFRNYATDRIAAAQAQLLMWVALARLRAQPRRRPTRADLRKAAGSTARVGEGTGR